MIEFNMKKLEKIKKTIFGICFSILAFGTIAAQTITINGVVEDENGKLLSNAIIKTINSSDTTDYLGRFKLTASKGNVLNIQKQGYKTRELIGKKALTVVLCANSGEKKVEMLMETRSEKELTSSISSLSNKGIKNNSVLAFGNALYGRIPGLNIKQSDGEPGDDYPALLIRGKHTFTGSNTPLVLVDGFEREYNTLSTDEVESVSVLKDAAATALYGMDGANGILIITTKRGIAGKSTIGLKVETGVSSPTRLPKFYGSYDYARYYNMAQKNDGKTAPFRFSDTQIEGYRLNADPKLYPNVDWFSETIRQNAPTKKYLLDFRGGNDVAKYYVNVGLENAEGIFKNTDHGSYSTNRNLNRMNFRSNIDINVSKRMSIRMDLAGRLEDVNEPTMSSASILNNLYTFHPNVAPVFVAPGIYGGSNTYRNNPVAYINEQGYKATHRRYFQSNIVTNYDLSDFVKGLAIGMRATFDNFYTVSDGYTKTYAVQEFIASPSGGSLSAPYGINGNLTTTGVTGESEYRRNNLEFYSKYNLSFGNHTISALAMYRQSEYVTGPDFPTKRQSLSGKISYDFNKKYFVDLVANYGASENFMVGRRFGLFPAISGAWVVSSESFMQDFTPISYLKLRASTGLVGNQNIGGSRFGYRNLYTSAGVEQTAGNPYLTWEKAYKTDLGIDLTLFKNTQLMFTYFNEFRDDILNSGDALIPNYFGNSFGYTNYGQVHSKGYELAIDHSKQFKNWGYNVGANVTFVQNEVTRMGELTRVDTYLYRQGQPVGQRFGLIALGLFQNQAEIDAAPVQSWGKVIPGSIRYKDVNEDGVVNSNDFTPIGKDPTVPDFDLGFNLGFNAYGFYVDANFQASIGREVNLRADNEGAMYSVSPLYGDKNVSTYVKNPWTPETAAIADFPSLSIENAGNNFQTSTYWLRNGDFLRLRALEIGYNLPKSLINNIRLSSASIYIRGMNVFTLDHIGYFDPEVMEGYPIMKSYNLGINLKF
jgi:TonB-linked SusC/RagA family outer membrane protein